VAFSGLLVLPSAWFALLNLMGRRPVSTLPAWFPRQGVLLFLLLIVEPLVLLAGQALSTSTSPIAWLLMPPLHLLALTVPVIWLVHLGCYGLSMGSPQRKWGIFASGLALGPGIIISLEIAAGIVMVLGLVALLAAQPGLLETLQQLIEQVSDDPSIPPEQISTLLLPYFQKPVTLYAVMAFLTVVAPLLEEMLKPIGVWLLAGRGLTGVEGFTAGVLCGAGFALMENLGYSAAGLGSWAAIAMARSGTAVMHITTSAMVGWALAATWRDGRYLRIAAVYLVAVIIHGLWNGITISLSLLGSQFSGALSDVVTLQVIAAAGLGLLMLILLVSMNAAHRRADAHRHAIMPPPVSSVEDFPPVETILSSKEDSGDGINATTV
jgi:RsiW-degrading membrane proteinase PrsW (M82 family)